MLRRSAARRTGFATNCRESAPECIQAGWTVLHHFATILHFFGERRTGPAM
jgi:hypothetical protein